MRMILKLYNKSIKNEQSSLWANWSFTCNAAFVFHIFLSILRVNYEIVVSEIL